jgi:hypothetical protein
LTLPGYIVDALAMAKSSSRTDGVKFQVKLSLRTSGWILKYADERQLPSAEVVRELVDDRLYLFGIPHAHYVRLHTAATKQRLPLAEYLKGLLVQHAETLPDGPGNLPVPTRMMDGPPTSKSGKRSGR